MATDVVTLLQNGLSPDDGTRRAAEAGLRSLEEANFGEYLVSLAGVLVASTYPVGVRNSAGLAIKNTLDAREVSRQDANARRWRELLPEDARENIKQASLATLSADERPARNAAGQVIAAVARVEMQQGTWPQLIPTLLESVSRKDNPALRQAALQALGYVCESVRPQILAAQSNEILTAVVQGAQKEEPSIEVRQSALQALLNSLDFVRDNFSREGERNYIMQIVCENTQNSVPEVQKLAYECLVKIMQLHYDKMQMYMERALFGITVLGMNSEDENVALQAVEFWSTVCEEEMDLALEYDELEYEGSAAGEGHRQSYNFAKLALPEILPTLLKLLTKQDDDATDDEWNVSMAAGTCLSLLAQTVADAIVVPIIPFVEQNFRHPDWHFREAAVMAFGSILDGPDAKLLSPLVAQALPTLIEMMSSEPNEHVKDTTAWCLGRISDVLVDTIKVEVHLMGLVQALMRGMSDSSRIVGNCCWAIMNLAEQLGTPENETSPMSPFYEVLVSTLLQTAQRDSNDANLSTRAPSYEALSTLATQAANDSLLIISNMLLTILERAEQLLGMQSQIVSSDDRNRYNELQISFCGVINAVVRRLGKQIQPLSNRIMTLLLSLISSCGKSSPILEDAFPCVGTMASTLEGDFAPFAGPFLGPLEAALQAHEEYSLVATGVGLVADICRALGPAAQPYTQGFMSVLILALQSQVLHRSVKPPIFSCFGDIALAIGADGFEPFVEATMTILAHAGSMRADPTNFDIVEYVNTLREGILEAYTGMVGAFKGTPKSALLLPYIPTIFAFLQIAVTDADRTEAIVRSSVGLIGDLASEFQKGEIKSELQADWISEAIKAARTRSTFNDVKNMAKWAKEMVRMATR